MPFPASLKNPPTLSRNPTAVSPSCRHSWFIRFCNERRNRFGDLYHIPPGAECDEDVLTPLARGEEDPRLMARPGVLLCGGLACTRPPVCRRSGRDCSGYDWSLVDADASNWDSRTFQL